MNAVARQPPAVRNRTDTFPSRLLHGQRRTRPRLDQKTLVLGESIDDAPHEDRLGPITIAGAVSGAYGGALTLDEPLDHRREHRVAREAIALGHQEHAGAVFAKSADRGQQPGSLL